MYCDLAKNVREAFEACELVCINCQGLNPSDYRKIGAKLKVKRFPVLVVNAIVCTHKIIFGKEKRSARNYDLITVSCFF